MDEIPNKVVQEYQQSTCEQLWQRPHSPQKQEAIQHLCGEWSGGGSNHGGSSTGAALGAAALGTVGGMAVGSMMTSAARAKAPPPKPYGYYPPPPPPAGYQPYYNGSQVAYAPPQPY